MPWSEIKRRYIANTWFVTIDCNCRMDYFSSTRYMSPYSSAPTPSAPSPPLPLSPLASPSSRPAASLSLLLAPPSLSTAPLLQLMLVARASYPGSRYLSARSIGGIPRRWQGVFGSQGCLSRLVSEQLAPVLVRCTPVLERPLCTAVFVRGIDRASMSAIKVPFLARFEKGAVAFCGDVC